MSGSLINTISGHREMPDVQVGDGMTGLMWSDRHAYTVVDRTASGKTLTLQADGYERTDDNGMSESQTYRSWRNTDAVKIKARWSDKKGAFVKLGGGTRFVLGRDCYYDYSF